MTRVDFVVFNNNCVCGQIVMGFMEQSAYVIALAAVFAGRALSACSHATVSLPNVRNRRGLGPLRANPS